MKFRKTLLALAAVISFGSSIGCSKINDLKSSLNQQPKKRSSSPTGGSSLDLLSNKQYTRLVIEIAYQADMQLSETAITHLVGFAGSSQITGKTVERLDYPIPANETMGLNEVTVAKATELENKYRQRRSQGDTMAVFFLVVNKPQNANATNEKVLGQAYGNTSVVIYEESIIGLSTGIGKNVNLKNKIEASVLTHEFGHLLGLVNLGLPMQNDHMSDTGHCSNPTCLMNKTINTDSAWINADDRNIIFPDIDSNCQSDLNAARNELNL